MKTKLTIVIILVMLPVISLFAQFSKEKSFIKSQRFKRIEMQHIGIGVETGINQNLYVGSKLYYGIGSFRNLINIDGGMKYLFCGRLKHNREESLSVQFFSVFCSLNVNPVRWNSGCLYVGSEISYNIVTSANHQQALSVVKTHDSRIGNNHFVKRGKVGARFNRWDINLYFDYNLAPAMDQKYVYESLDFDYDQLYSSIHERNRIGVAVSYFIPF